MPTLSQVARRQHGLVTRAQALRAGLSPSAIEYRLASGRWRRAASGVYCPAETPRSWRQSVMAACLATGGVASHRTAAALFGLSGFVARGIEVTVLVGRNHRSSVARVHRSSSLDGSMIDGIPVTRPVRTLIDLASCVGEAALAEAVDDALVRRLVTLARLERQYAEARGRRGSAAMGSVLAAWRDGGVPQEVAEMRLVRRLVAAGLPRPELQHEIHVNGRFVARLDAAWPEVKVGFELDGFRWHGTPAGHQRDMARHNRMKAAGWTVFQASPADLRSDGRTLAALAAPFFASRRAMLPA